MIKIVRSLSLFLGVLLCSSFSNAATCITCTQGGGCMTYACGAPPADWGFDLFFSGVYVHNSVPASMIQSLNTQIMSGEAYVQRTCAENAGRIYSTYSKCRTGLFNDNIRETERCSTLKNVSLESGFEFGYKIVIGSVTTTIENPTYDKCINKKDSIMLSAVQDCDNKKSTDMTNARRTSPAMCEKYYPMN